MTKRIGILLATLAAAFALLGPGGAIAQAQNGLPSGGSGVQCQQIWQYQVHTAGDMTNAESGGSVIASAIPGQLFNVRIQGNPRYFGFNTGNGVWGWILASKLAYTGNTWCG